MSRAAENPPRIVSCPTCSERVKWTEGNPHRPLCSERCKLLDLGAWADETHTIPGDAAHDAVSEGLQPDGR